MTRPVFQSTVIEALLGRATAEFGAASTKIMAVAAAVAVATEVERTEFHMCVKAPLVKKRLPSEFPESNGSCR